MEKIEKFFISENLLKNLLNLLLLGIAFILNLFHDLKIRGRNGLIMYLKIDWIYTYNMYNNAILH